jgi:hypothetical protein
MIKLDLPWWTFAATQHIESFLNNRIGDTKIFEYGPGASTIWLSKRADKVFYVEHDRMFYEKLLLLTKNTDNVTGVYCEPKPKNDNAEKNFTSGRKGYENFDFEEYVKSIELADGPFDLIVIDGRARTACLLESLKHLKADGIILFDNSARKRYQDTFNSEAITIKRYAGLAPALPFKEETSIITK